MGPCERGLYSIAWGQLWTDPGPHPSYCPSGSPQVDSHTQRGEMEVLCAGLAPEFGGCSTLGTYV